MDDMACTMPAAAAPRITLRALRTVRAFLHGRRISSRIAVTSYAAAILTRRCRSRSGSHNHGMKNGLSFAATTRCWRDKTSCVWCWPAGLEDARLAVLSCINSRGTPPQQTTPSRGATSALSSLALRPSHYLASPALLSYYDSYRMAATDKLIFYVVGVYRAAAPRHLRYRYRTVAAAERCRFLLRAQGRKSATAHLCSCLLRYPRRYHHILPRTRRAPA